MINESYIGHILEKVSSPAIHGHLSLAQLVKNELHVLVLDYPTKLKWAGKNRLIKLLFLKEDHNKKLTFHACVNKSFLLFLWHDDKHWFEKIFSKYEIYTGELLTSIPVVNYDRSMTDDEFVAIRIPYLKK
ncbi:hypothetical protein R3W88_015909 [Solanum pinnatisectum]|uniref:Uncharacterized protein n=1 Tax=Solanum pinnatisectum TaxID=50273 RepID=A0AAV9KW74_9SOLN|nr:hypothetical protein R3W88_015909 [Solanum pinnatisectum]